MTAERLPIQPIRPAFRANTLTDQQLDQLQEATLTILENTGVLFPSERALAILADHGAQVDHERQIVRFPRDLVIKAMRSVPRYYCVGARDPQYDLMLQDGVTYFTTDGCGVEAVDFHTRERRPSCKADVALMARIADYLPSIAFYWPMVSAQDYGRAAPLHELDAAWNNTVKHIQSVTCIGPVLARNAIEMALVISGDSDTLRRRPPFSGLICTVAPLVQDGESIDGALVLAEAGIPVGILAMPTIGTTAPATLAGALAVADAEVISAAVLIQLAFPGAPVLHSVMHAWADPRSGAYVSYPINVQARYAPIELAHHWGMPVLGGAFGTESLEPGTWQSAAEVALDPLLVGLAGAEMVTGLGLNRSYTLLYPEAIILDDELYHRARHALTRIDIDAETLALDVINTVGPGSHFLAQRHTRVHMPTAMEAGLTHHPGDGGYADPVAVAREKVAWILEHHHPEPLEPAVQAELSRILAAAGRELES